MSLRAGASQRAWLTDPSLKGPSLLDHGQGGFRTETEKTERIIGDRAETSTASLVQCGRRAWRVCNRAWHPRRRWEHAGDGHAADAARGDGPAQRQPRRAFPRQSPTPHQTHARTHHTTVPTRETSRRTGCSVGSSRISPAATMGIMAVKILVRKAQTDSEKTARGRRGRRRAPLTRPPKGSLLAYVLGGTGPAPSARGSANPGPRAAAFPGTRGRAGVSGE